jgi:hypothetical protein
MFEFQAGALMGIPEVKAHLRFHLRHLRSNQHIGGGPPPKGTPAGGGEYTIGKSTTSGRFQLLFSPRVPASQTPVTTSENHVKLHIIIRTYKMSQIHPTLAHVRRHFAKHPDVEFMVLDVSADALAEMSDAGWIAAFATKTSKPGRRVQGVQRFGQTEHTIIVRRANALAGRPLPGVLVMDGAPASPQGKTPQAQDGFGRSMWGLAQVADARRVSLVELIMDPAALATASAMIAPSERPNAS